MQQYSVIGKPIPRRDSFSKITGEALYTDDLTRQGMLYGKVLRSPHAHARILNIDASRALKLPGVKAVVTGRDILPRKFGSLIGFADQYALCLDKVRYVGDDVAAVAAMDLDTAEEALDLIKVDYEILPAVFDLLQAMEQGAPLIHEDKKSNVSAGFRRLYGEPEAAWARADYIREDTFTTQAVSHAPLEPHVALASYEPVGGNLTLWAPKQMPFLTRKILSFLLGLEENRLRVIITNIGGGFGGKGEVFACDFCSAYLSLKTGRPVKITYTREEALTCSRTRHAMTMHIKTGVLKDGSIIAQQIKFLADGGAYLSLGPLTITLASYAAMLPFRIPNMLIEASHVYTNKQAAGAMRGHGGPQIRFAVESQLDMIAHDLALDPAEIRLKNAVEASQPHPAGLTIRSCGLKESITKASEMIDWEAKPGSQAGLGKGMACSSYFCGVNMMPHIGGSGVLQMHRDGSVILLTGACDLGQGSDSMLAQITAEELGICYEDVKVLSADTELTPMDFGTFGSGVTMRVGNAVWRAAKDLKMKLFSVVAEELGVKEEDLRAANREIWVEGDPGKRMTLNNALKLYQRRDLPIPIVGSGFYHMQVKEWPNFLTEPGDISTAYSFGTQAAEVQVNTETGQVEVKQVLTAHDSGKILNPLAAEGQLEGSIMGGIGQALYEEFNWSEQGLILNTSFLDYKLPTMLEGFQAGGLQEIDSHDTMGPFGAKEAGEGAQIFTLPAIANAIFDAAGVRIKDLPITPQKILAALEK